MRVALSPTSIVRRASSMPLTTRARTNAHGKRLIQVLVDVAFAEDAPLIANVGNLADSVLFHMLPFQTIEGLSPSLQDFSTSLRCARNDNRGIQSGGSVPLSPPGV